MRLALFVALLCLPAAAPAAETIAGRWLTENGKAVVTIARCGPAACGRITRVLAPHPGGPALDRHNPNAALRARPIQGLEILSGFTDHGGDWQGRIYSPENGKSYRSIAKRTPTGGLSVQGCIAFFCRTQLWKPAP